MARAASRFRRPRVLSERHLLRRDPGTAGAAAASTTTTVPTTSGQVPLAGCPVPPQPPVPPSSPPWHPAVLVTSLPPVEAPSPWTSHVAALTGKGMWIWEWDSTDGGDADEIVQQAVSAGLHQLWVRVGDSKDGFYGAEELDSLVPVAHAHGLAVIVLGFPVPVGPRRRRPVDGADPRLARLGRPASRRVRRRYRGGDRRGHAERRAGGRVPRGCSASRR